MEPSAVYLLTWLTVGVLLIALHLHAEDQKKRYENSIARDDHEQAIRAMQSTINELLQSEEQWREKYQYLADFALLAYVRFSEGGENDVATKVAMNRLYEIVIYNKSEAE